MVELHFQVIVAPLGLQFQNATETKLERKMMALRKEIESCGLCITMFDIVKLAKSEDCEYPEVTELIVDVQAKYPTVFIHAEKLRSYQEFSKKWQNLTSQFDEKDRSMISFHLKESFIPTRAQCHHNISCNSISFGTLPECGRYLQYATLDASLCLLNFSHDVRSLEVQYHWQYTTHKMVIAYSNIRRIVVCSSNSFTELFLDLFHPPLFYKVDKKRTRLGISYEINHRVLTTGIDVSVVGKANMIKFKVPDNFEVKEIISRLHFRCGKLPVCYVHVTSQSKSQPHVPLFDLPHFGCTYLLNAMFHRNFILVEQSPNIAASLNILRQYSTDNGDSLEKTLTIVLSALDSGKMINYWDAIKHFYMYYIDNKNEINFRHYIVPEKCRSIRRVMLTPTRMLLWPPEYMSENRVLRNFDSDFALRVNFRDDNISRLSWGALYAREEIFESAIKNPMLTGITIGYRLFEFLAWSNSQIRDHGVWMYAKDNNGNSSSDIRQWMGDFSHIHNVPKYMARMGQCFSQTEDAVSVPLNENHIRTENDIEHGIDPSCLKPYCFSDGIGKISTNLAKKVHEALGHDEHCSAFQIRYGGYKGMLVVDPTLKDADIVFRNSMKKFDSPLNTRLEICQTSAPSQLQLNRPFVTILNDMGVRHRTFLKLQENQLRYLTDMLIDEEKAAVYLNSKAPSGIVKYKELSLSGISLTTEPFFRTLLLALHRRHVDNIKTRANITIEPSQGRNLLGVLDETGKLNYGEVFVQYTIDITLGETGKDTKVLKGEVLVTKNPCTHPGDVRKFQAVDIPQLHHIVDCIVFPQTGERPHPNEMAGSDLDGDEYACLWDKELIFHRQNFQPAHYPSASSLSVSDIRIPDMINFLIKYVQDDQIGVIANAHLAHADKSDIFSPTCLQIAKKHSIAVDFAKNGSSAHLIVEERPQTFPDFMEKNYKVTYNSSKALGKMYRICKDFESENEQASITYCKVKVDPDLEYPGWKNFECDAIQARNRYNSLLRSVLQTYGIQHEAEAFSGAFSQLHCRYQERKDKAEIEKVVIGCIKALSKNFLKEFLGEFSCSNVNVDTNRMLQKASAWYVVTYRDSQSAFLSFAWVVSKFLANIKCIKTSSAKIMRFSPVIVQMDSQISENAIKLPPLSYATKDSMDLYEYACQKHIVENALRVLMIWAQDNEIVEVPGYNTRGLMFLNVFVKLFLLVAEQECYLWKKASMGTIAEKKVFSSATLVLAFLRFCVTLRFYNKYKIGEVLPFHVYNYRKLSKRAMVTYHAFALSGVFPALIFEPEAFNDVIEMKPFYIENKIFPFLPISDAALREAELNVLKYSKVNNVEMREVHQTKKVLVTAAGNEQSIKTLKDVLRKKHAVIRQLFTTGILE